MVQQTNEKIRVRADRDLDDLIPGFLENRRRDIEAIRNHLISGDYYTIERLGHAMKGSGGGYGFDEISRIGMLIERFAKDNNNAGIIRNLNALAEYLERVELIYE